MIKLVDDVLDFTGSPQDLGKPAAIDLSLGLATAPGKPLISFKACSSLFTKILSPPPPQVLFAMEEFPEMRRLVERGFKEEGDVAKAFSLVQSSQVSKTAVFELGRAVFKYNMYYAKEEIFLFRVWLCLMSAGGSPNA